MRISGSRVLSFLRPLLPAAVVFGEKAALERLS